MAGETRRVKVRIEELKARRESRSCAASRPCSKPDASSVTEATRVTLTILFIISRADRTPFTAAGEGRIQDLAVIFVPQFARSELQQVRREVLVFQQFEIPVPEVPRQLSKSDLRHVGDAVK